MFPTLTDCCTEMLGADDTPAVIAEPRSVCNVRYHDRPVSRCTVESSTCRSSCGRRTSWLGSPTRRRSSTGGSGSSTRHSTAALGSLKVLLGKEEIVQRGLRQTLNATDARWLLGDLRYLGAV